MEPVTLLIGALVVAGAVVLGTRAGSPATPRPSSSATNTGGGTTSPQRPSNATDGKKSGSGGGGSGFGLGGGGMSGLGSMLSGSSGGSGVASSTDDRQAIGTAGDGGFDVGSWLNDYGESLADGGDNTPFYGPLTEDEQAAQDEAAADQQAYWDDGNVGPYIDTSTDGSDVFYGPVDSGDSYDEQQDFWDDGNVGPV